MLFSKRLCPKNQFLQGNGVERVETLEANRAIVTKSPWGSSPKGAAQKAWNVPAHWGVALGAGNPPSNHHRRKDSHVTFYVANSSGPKFPGPEVWPLLKFGKVLLPTLCQKLVPKLMPKPWVLLIPISKLKPWRRSVLLWAHSLEGAAWRVLCERLGMCQGARSWC